MAKLVTDALLKKNIKDILTELVNNTYSWEEYTPEQISDILEITDEQAMELSKIISDSQIANNKLWSSSKTDTEIKNALIESNKYADELIGKISSISLEYVTTLPTSDIKSNVIYILQGTPNTLNVYNESTSSFVSVGDLNLDLTGYYDKTAVDNLLADKADDNTVVHADDVVQDLTTTSGSTTLSTAGLQTELDKKANDDEVVKTADIATTIDSTSTDDTVPSTKAVYNTTSKFLKTYTSIEQLGLTNGSETIEDIANSMEGFTRLIAVIERPNISIYPHYNGTLIVEKLNPYRVHFKFCIDELPVVYVGTYHTISGFSGWKRLCATSVADVPLTTVPLDSSKFQNGSLLYEVKNGVCYVYIKVLNANTTLSHYEINTTPMPKPSGGLVTSPIASDANGSAIGLFYIDTSFNSTPRCHIFISSLSGYATFSYPVAES